MPPSARQRGRADARQAAALGNARVLGWIVRFMPSEQMIAVGRFCETEVGLPRIRSIRHAVDGGRQDKDFYWAGECVVLETFFFSGSRPASEADGDPARAPLIPIFRSPDLGALLAEWASRGLEPVSIAEIADGREAFVRDPAGQLIGARQVLTPTSRHDREAVRRRARGEAFNPGCPPMPALIQEVGWVRRRLADVATARAFYGGVIGLALIAEGDGWAHYDLGDNIVLELLSGGAARPAPAAQVETTGVPILRVDDTIALRERARSAGHTVVHELYDVPRGLLCYVDDGEGNIVGFMQMHHPGRYAAQSTPAAEDLEAERRWAELRAAG